MLATYTASIFRIEPLTGIPIEPLIDLVPGITPLRVTFDLVDSESITYEYDVTEHAIQGFLDVSTHVKKRLERLSLTGTFSALGPMVPGPQPPNPAGFARLDVQRVVNLRLIADSKLPVMILTPRMGLARAFLTSVSPSWGKDDAESMVVSVSATEARLVLPGMTSPVQPDYPSQAPGANEKSGGGQGGTVPVEGSFDPPATPGTLPGSVA